MALGPDDLNAMDKWILDFLAEHEWATPNLLRKFYNDEQTTDDDRITRQWVANRLTRLSEHDHVEKVHSDAAEYRLKDDPRN